MIGFLNLVLHNVDSRNFKTSKAAENWATYTNSKFLPAQERNCLTHKSLLYYCFYQVINLMLTLITSTSTFLDKILSFFISATFSYFISLYCFKFFQLLPSWGLYVSVCRTGRKSQIFVDIFDTWTSYITTILAWLLYLCRWDAQFWPNTLTSDRKGRNLLMVFH